MKPYFYSFCFLAISYAGMAQTDTLWLSFIGDIMGHDQQIEAAYNPKTKKYNYWSSFKEIAPSLQSADFTFGNLELTLSGKPYHGYPVFSSPDELTIACKKAGIDVLLTANNHVLDFSSKGLIRTIEVLDSIGIKHTGSFRSKAERRSKNLLILHKNNIRVGLLNYTFSTNGIRVPRRVAVNKIDTIQMQKDIQRAKRTNIDKLIVFLHWGDEYKNQPNTKQKKIADFLKRQEVDIVVGAHPHVLQPIEFHASSANSKQNSAHVLAYSLGNFISGQRSSGRDGGAILHIALVKPKKDCQIVKCEYELTWVYNPTIKEKSQFIVLPAATYERNNLLPPNAQNRMERFLKKARKQFKQANLNVQERNGIE